MGFIGVSMLWAVVCFAVIGPGGVGTWNRQKPPGRKEGRAEVAASRYTRDTLSRWISSMTSGFAQLALPSSRAIQHHRVGTLGYGKTAVHHVL